MMSSLTRNKHVPLRRCVSCRTQHSKDLLIRIAKDSEGHAVIDRTKKLPGRGAYICPDEKCITKAGKSGVFTRMLNLKTSPEFWCELGEYAVKGAQLFE